MQTLTHLSHLKILGHPQRLEILKYLMRQAGTLSQLGAYFNESAAHIRHHIKLLEEEGLVALTTPPPVHNHLEKYYRATEEAWLVQLAILPRPEAGEPTLILASKDLAARRVAQAFGELRTGLDIQFLPLNSLEGLMRLNQGLCQMATCHLKDPDTGQYNRSF
ncbi:MAG TPA: helix-turn-helix domain-containing protein, partial [Anaerolineales bacterium]|nr:helix-turn-helix domain-containing protein [Anaerolineales bacterium]